MLKTLKRTIRVGSDKLNSWKYRALREVEETQKTMVDEMIDTTLRENLPTTRKRLHERFYNQYREKYPTLPSRVIEGAYITTSRIIKSFKKRRKKGLARKEKPEYKKIMITIPNMINWKFNKSVSISPNTQGLGRDLIKVHETTNPLPIRWLEGFTRVEI